MSCQKAQEFLEANDWQVADQFDAAKDRRGREEALAKSARKIVVAKGKKVVAFDMPTDPPDDETLLAHLLGPTGNLRAPTMRHGQTLLVGFSEDAYKQVLSN
jgi:hypothetical protein